MKCSSAHGSADESRPTRKRKDRKLQRCTLKIKQYNKHLYIDLSYRNKRKDSASYQNTCTVVCRTAVPFVTFLPLRVLCTMKGYTVPCKCFRKQIDYKYLLSLFRGSMLSRSLRQDLPWRTSTVIKCCVEALYLSLYCNIVINKC